MTTSFSDFPSGCTSYNGPHSTACVQSVWSMHGCVKEVHTSTGSLVAENTTLVTLGIRYDILIRL